MIFKQRTSEWILFLTLLFTHIQEFKSSVSLDHVHFVSSIKKGFSSKKSCTLAGNGPIFSCCVPYDLNSVQSSNIAWPKRFMKWKRQKYMQYVLVYWYVCAGCAKKNDPPYTKVSILFKNSWIFALNLVCSTFLGIYRTRTIINRSLIITA